MPWVGASECRSELKRIEGAETERDNSGQYVILLTLTCLLPYFLSLLFFLSCFSSFLCSFFRVSTMQYAVGWCEWSRCVNEVTQRESEQEWEANSPWTRSDCTSQHAMPACRISATRSSTWSTINCLTNSATSSIQTRNGSKETSEEVGEELQWSNHLSKLLPDTQSHCKSRALTVCFTVLLSLSFWVTHSVDATLLPMMLPHDSHS